MFALAAFVCGLRYGGGVFGVRADVQLNLSSRTARVRLRGIPIGGRVEGSAHFDEEGQLVLSPALHTALRRRAVRIEHAGVADAMDTCWVTADLPVVGHYNITLEQL